MKKRIFALALALCMMVSVMPTSFANGVLTLGDDSNGVLTLDNGTSGRSITTSGSVQPLQDGVLYNTSGSGTEDGTIPVDDPVVDTSGALDNAGEEPQEASINTSWSGSGNGQASDVGTPVTNNKVGTAKSIVTVDGKEYLRLESYVTGSTTTTTVTSTKPMDVVLVLDQSGSMMDTFEAGVSRQIAMENAVNAFIGAVHDKYSNTADHRISIVTFGTTASQVAGWTFVNDSGNEDLQDKVTGLNVTQYATYTNIGLGMELAEGLMNPAIGYSYNGANTTREKVVILFTDGVPTSTSTDFDIAVANKALAHGYNLKNTYDTTIYTIGIFGGADPDMLHGPGSNGSVDSSWEAGALLFWGDVGEADAYAGNRFLNYLSSNFMSANEIGLKKDEFNIVIAKYIKYTIQKNFERDESGYYKTAENAATLNTIFTDISNTSSEGGASISLDETTKVTDVISDYFKLPAGTKAENILVYTADYNGSDDANITAGDWGSDAPLTLKEGDIVVDPTNKTVSVKGFDFAENYVGVDNVNGEPVPHGKKLIVLIPIEQEADFLGGNDVVTNAPGSGVLGQEKDGTYTMVETFVSPTKDVRIPAVTVASVGKNVYLSYGMSVEDMLRDATIKIGDVALDLSKADFGLSEAQRAYLKSITLTATDNEDGTFTVSCEVTTTDSDNKSSGSGSANINVFKPVITFEDSTIYLGEKADYTDNYGDPLVVWKNGQTSSDDEGVTMTGKKPSVDVEYSPVAAKFEECQDVSITTVKLNDNGNYVNDTTFLNSEEETDDVQFTVHVVKPVISNTDTTIYLGNTTDLNDRMIEADKWICDGTCGDQQSLGHSKLEDGETVRVAPAVTYTFTGTNVDEDGVADPEDCTTYKSETSVGGVPVKQKDEQVIVHVLKPQLSVSDAYIYQGQTTGLDNRISVCEKASWIDTKNDGTSSNIEGEPDMDGFVYTFTDVKNKDAYTADTCTPITVATAKINGKDVMTYFEDTGFIVHVLKPHFTVNTTDLWADYGAKVELYKGGENYSAIDAVTNVSHTWVYTGDCSGDGVHPAELPAGTPTAPTITLNEVTFAEGDSYEVGTTDGTITVNSVKYTSSAAGAMETATDLTVKKNGEVTERVTIHVNKFDLTINKTWLDGEKAADGTYKQDAIFTVSGGLGDFQVVLPAGQESIEVTGLLCGQTYTVTEDDNWTWRWDSDNAVKTITGDPHDVSTTDPHDAEHDEEVSFVNSLAKRLWLSFCTFVKNIFGQAAIQKGGSF